MIHLTFVANSGSGRYVASLVTALAQSSAETALVCPSDFEFLGEVRRAGVVVHAFVPAIPICNSVRFVLYNATRSIGTVLRMVGRHWNNRVVHANFIGVPLFSAPVMAALRICGFRVILTVHDVLPHTWLFPRRLRAVERWTYSLLYQMAHHLVVLHSGAAQQLSETIGIRRDHIEVIPHGTFKIGGGPVPLPESNEIVALVFGSLRRNKGIHLAIEAVQQLRFEGVSIRLRIVGSPSRKELTYWEQCKARIAVRPDGIEVREQFIADDEIYSELERCHFMLLPYCDFGSQSGVASLALSNGRCIVATRSGGLGDLLKLEAGLEIEQESVKGVLAALQKTVELGKEGLAALGVRAYEVFTRKYSWEAIAEQHLCLYEKISERKSTRAVRSNQVGESDRLHE